MKNLEVNLLVSESHFTVRRLDSWSIGLKHKTQQNHDSNQPLQLTAGSFGFSNVSGVAAGFGWSDVFRHPPAATELGR
mgnify:CR=1 FL=1